MRPFTILAVGLLAAMPAAAETPSQAAAAEAHTFFVPCSALDPQFLDQCLENHELFLDAYVRAKAGADEYMRHLTRFFGTNPKSFGTVNYYGLRADRLQGCAWVMVRHELAAEGATRTSLLLQYKTACGDIADGDAILARASDLIYELRTHPAEAPPPSESALDHGCLESVARSDLGRKDVWPGSGPGCLR